jgi:DNA polymerase III epsilon subunit-like protein
MKLLFLDTETNGLPTNRYASYTAINMWPHVIQISWQLVDTTDWSVISDQDAFIQQRETWSKDAERIHQIPESVVRKYGLEPLTVFQNLYRDISCCDGIVAHNLSFDKTAIKCELQRLYEAGALTIRPDEFWNPRLVEFCTMVISKEFCAIPFPSGEGYKFPRLNELYMRLFGKEYDISGAALHNAKYDVACLIMCYRKMVELPAFANLIKKRLT